MPEVRNVSSDVREVPAYGLTVAPGAAMRVPDDDVESWKYQEGVWELVGNDVVPDSPSDSPGETPGEAPSDDSSANQEG